MNKIFKVIWNRTTQSLVVTSELAKGAAKASCENTHVETKTSFGKIFKLSAVTMALLGVVGTTNAAYTPSYGLGSADSIAISGNFGKKADALGQDGTTHTGNIAIGTESAAKGGNAVAIGYESKTMGNGGTAVGQGAKAGTAKEQGRGSSAFGYYSVASANNATALGSESKALTGSATAVGYKADASGLSVTALGTNATA